MKFLDSYTAYLTKEARPVKRSVTIAGHRTSFSLEEPFWVGLQEISASAGVPINLLIKQLDELRFCNGIDVGLSGAVRLFVFKYFLDQLDHARSKQPQQMLLPL